MNVADAPMFAHGAILAQESSRSVAMGYRYSQFWRIPKYTNYAEQIK